ncbi:transmembrane protein 131 isoform X2 [Oratosquilla oratoria]|uniref:transmembrane protein 131 isoform X2 n=1 Tax=Oratosquilla oratoria TaxID=337810 RepID=UPI003F776891
MREGIMGTFWCKIFVIFSVLEIVINLVDTVDGQSHAFIQVDNELRYLVDGVSIHMNEIIKSGDSEIRYGDIIEDRGVPPKNYIVFNPPLLDFKEHPTGMPLMKKVVVYNSSPDTSVQLHSLSGNTLHFHCTFFQDKVVGPGGNTSFDVVFLGREEGPIENTIFVHTSVGTYKYVVRAVGTGNPYRLRPLVGVKMPLNSSYSPLIQLHNPHPHPLQVTEMYSTGGDLHLELPTGSQEGQRTLWKIPPYRTRSLMKANFVARRENNHTAYVRIVTSESNGDYLVVAVEVEVTGQAGLYCPQDGLHFGLLTPHDQPAQLPLQLLNSAHKHIHIQNVITTPVNEAITIDFKPVKIPPGTVKATQIATVTFDPSKVASGKKVSGKILIKSKVSAYKLSVPFTVDMLHGALQYNASITRFYTGTEVDQSGGEGGGTAGLTDSSNPRNLTLTNTFPTPVVIYNLTLPQHASTHFQVTWTGPVVVGTGQSAVVAALRLLSIGSDLRLTTALTVHTNITNINIPLLAYNGKLTKYIPPSGGWLDFGTLGMGEQRDIFFYVINQNPVELRLRGWGSNLTRSAVELMGVEEGNITTIKNRNNMTYTSKSLFLKPNHYAVFRIGVLTPDIEGVFIAESFVQTQYEQIKIPFRLRTADGTLSVVPSVLLFDNAFPGKISKQNLYILSTFGHPMTVSDVKSLGVDGRFCYLATEATPPSLQPGHKSHVGKLIFDPKQECGHECYVGFSLASKAGQQWLNTLSLTSHVADTDTSLYSMLLGRYLNLSSHHFNTSLVLDTSEVKGFHFTAQVALKWPQLTTPSQLVFPLTLVQNSSIREVFVENPASVPVVAQVLLLHHYPATQHLLSIIQHQAPDGHSLFEDDSGDAFSLLDIDQVTPPSSPTASGGAIATESTLNFVQQRRSLEEQFKTRVAKDSIAFVLEPGVKVKVRVSFSPVDDRLRSSVVLVRNNLTVIDAVLVQGRGGRGHLKFANRKPGSAMPLTFNIGPKHLKDCDNSKSSKYYQPNFTVKRSFTARNTGELPVHISGFNINDIPCEGYGFKVLNCQAFDLAPNDSRKVDIAFTPDFTLSKVQQQLIIHTNLEHVQEGTEGDQEGGRVLYSLVATVPSHLLGPCAAAVPRPSWEPLLYYCLLTLMLAMVAGVVVLAFLEAEHIIKITVVALTTSLPMQGHIPPFDKSKVFDLRTISQQESKNLLSGKNGYINGHLPIDKSLPSNSGHKKPSNSNSSISTLLIPNASKGKKSSHNHVTSHSTKSSKYAKSSDFKCEQPSRENPSSMSEIGSPSCKSSKKTSKGEHTSALSWPSFFTRTSHSKQENETDNYVKIDVNKSETTVHKQSIGTETDLHIVENLERRSKRKTKQSSEEETSSTTTESSNTDDLSISERDCSVKCSEQPSTSSSSQGRSCTKRRSNRNRGSCSRGGQSFSADPSVPCKEDETGFEISTKFKGLKKHKDPSSRGYGGDIFQPNSLELPYTLKPLRKDPDHHHDSRKNSKNKTTKRAESSESVDGSGRSSPAPIWEEPRRPSDEGLNELVNQTQNFAMNQARTNQTDTKQPLESRKTYSSILLGNNDKQKTKVTPVGKIAPEKRADKPLGAIGQKVECGNVKPGTGLAVSPRHQNNSFFSLPDTNVAPHSFIKEESYAGLGRGSSLYNNGGSDSNGGNMNIAPGSSHSWDPKTLTAPSPRPPPGLSIQHSVPPPHHTMPSEGDWLQNYNALSSGSALWSDASLFRGPGLGSAAAPTGSGLWNSIWSSPFVSSGSNAVPQQPAPPSPSAVPTCSSLSIWSSSCNNTGRGNYGSGAVSEGLGFDPFRTVASIWSSGGDSAWPPKSPKKDNSSL